VILIELLKSIAAGLGLTRKPQAIKFIKDNDITVLVNAKCLEIKDKSVILEQNGEGREVGGIDSFVMAVGVRPEHNVRDLLKDMGYSYHVIGDAKEAGKALDAIWEGAAIGREL
jgi:NADH dehydrogenase FAD-containing subunit